MIDALKTAVYGMVFRFEPERGGKQPRSGNRRCLEIYSRLSLADAQRTYDKTISRFPV